MAYKIEKIEGIDSSYTDFNYSFYADSLIKARLPNTLQLRQFFNA
jgi:hypothetical protein